MAPPTVDRIINHVVKANCDPDFRTALPESVSLEQWTGLGTLGQGNKHKYNRMKVLGTSVLHTGLSVALDRNQGLSSGIVTCIRSALSCHFVLAMLAKNFDASILPEVRTRSVLKKAKKFIRGENRGKLVQTAIVKTRHKEIADRYRALVGDLYRCVGMYRACSWVESTFAPLIAAAIEALESQSIADAPIGAGAPVGNQPAEVQVDVDLTLDDD